MLNIADLIQYGETNIKKKLPWMASQHWRIGKILQQLASFLGVLYQLLQIHSFFVMGGYVPIFLFLMQSICAKYNEIKCLLELSWIIRKPINGVLVYKQIPFLSLQFLWCQICARISGRQQSFLDHPLSVPPYDLIACSTNMAIILGDNLITKSSDSSFIAYDIPQLLECPPRHQQLDHEICL